MTLTSDLVSRISIESGAHLVYSLRKESQIKGMYASLDADMSCTSFGSLCPWHLTKCFRINVSETYLLYDLS